MSFTDEEAIWDTIGQDGYALEHAKAPLRRKQTGSYYTDLALAMAMTEELVESLPAEKKSALFDCTFLEPCVGTGNFVFAYLRVCQRLGYTADEYRTLINNIYVCDIDRAALAVYRKNLTLFAQRAFGIVLDDRYFATHIGGALLSDIDAQPTRYIPITDVFPAEVVRSGFDLVVTDPPYKNLKAERSHYPSVDEHQRDKAKYAEIGQWASKVFPNASTGTINLYTLFVEEIVRRYLAPDGSCSLLIPVTILSDRSCAKLRALLLSTAALKTIRIIAENDRCVDASQALCTLLLRKGKNGKDPCHRSAKRRHPSRRAYRRGGNGQRRHRRRDIPFDEGTARHPAADAEASDARLRRLYQKPSGRTGYHAQ